MLKRLITQDRESTNTQLISFCTEEARIQVDEERTIQAHHFCYCEGPSKHKLTGFDFDNVQLRAKPLRTFLSRSNNASGWL